MAHAISLAGRLTGVLGRAEARHEKFHVHLEWVPWLDHGVLLRVRGDPRHPAGPAGRERDAEQQSSDEVQLGSMPDPTGLLQHRRPRQAASLQHRES